MMLGYSVKDIPGEVQKEQKVKLKNHLFANLPDQLL